jgi:iron complex outermembrane receptor protein
MHVPFFFRRCACAGLALGLCAALFSTPARAQTVVPPTLLGEPVAAWPGAPGSDDLGVPVTLTVRADGTVSKVELVRPADPELDAVAVRTALGWRFAPATRDGVPVAARVRAEVRFNAPPRPTAPNAAATATGDPTKTATPPSRSSAPPPAAGIPPATPATTTAVSDSVMKEEVVVQGRAPTPSRGASDFEMPVGELARVPRKNASELLKLAPGVFLTNEGGDGHAERIYLRGFDAREGQDIEVTVDSVPVNESGNLHGNGFADLNFIIPELVLSLRVLEGPFDPRQGNYAVAGSASYEMGLQKRGLTGKVTLGSYGTRRALVTWGPPGESAHTYGGAEIASSDGFGQNRDSRRGGAMAQYEGRLSPKTTFRVSGAAYANSYHSAGLLRADAVDSGRQGFYDTADPAQGGDGSRFQLATDIETKQGDFVLYQQLFAIRRSMRLRENFTGFLLDPQEAIQSPHGQRGDLFDMHVAESTLGGRGWARTHGALFGHEQELELGYFARSDGVEGLQQRIDAATGAPYRTETHLDSELADIGLYADVALRPLGWLTLRGGVRADLFLYDVHDLCAVKDVSLPSPDDPPGDASCLEQQRGGEHREPDQRSSTASTKPMPRATVLFGPFSHVTFSLAWGQGVRSIDPSYVTQDVATPFASVFAEEAGVAYAHSFDAAAVSLRSVFFRTHVDKDLVFSETEGRSVLGGGTTRSGWSGALRVTNDFIDENANVTLVRSAFDETGLLVPYVPDLVVRSDTALNADLPFAVAGYLPHGSLGLGASYVGRRALPYGQRSDTLFTLDGSAAIRYRSFELELAVTNLLDTRYKLAEYDFVSNFPATPGAAPTLVPARHFAAGAPRMLFVSLSATLGGS